MPKFTDKKGRTWEVELDIATCRRIDASDFSLHYNKPFSIFQMDQPAMQRLFSDASFMFAVIWAIVEPQANAYEAFRSVEDKLTGEPRTPTEDERQIEFVSAINPKAKADGTQAFLEALGDFFPELKTGSSMLSQAQAVLSKKLEEGMGKAMPALEQLMDQQLDKAILDLRAQLGKPGETSSHSELSPATA